MKGRPGKDGQEYEHGITSHVCEMNFIALECQKTSRRAVSLAWKACRGWNPRSWRSGSLPVILLSSKVSTSNFDHAQLISGLQTYFMLLPAVPQARLPQLPHHHPTTVLVSILLGDIIVLALQRLTRRVFPLSSDEADAG